MAGPKTKRTQTETWHDLKGFSWFLACKDFSFTKSQDTKKSESAAGVAEDLHPVDCPSVGPEEMSQWGWEGSLWQDPQCFIGGRTLVQHTHTHTAPARLPTSYWKQQTHLQPQSERKWLFFGLFDLDFISTLDSPRPPRHVTRLWTLKTRRQTASF